MHEGCGGRAIAETEYKESRFSNKSDEPGAAVWVPDRLFGVKATDENYPHKHVR